MKIETKFNIGDSVWILESIINTETIEQKIEIVNYTIDRIVVGASQVEEGKHYIMYANSTGEHRSIEAITFSNKETADKALIEANKQLAYVNEKIKQQANDNFGKEKN